MDLFIIRHAWAGDRDDLQWPDDDLRPLTDSGKKRFAQVAAKLVDSGVVPGVIAASPLLRCVQTAGILAKHIPGNPEVSELDALRPGSDLAAAMHWTTQQAERHQYIAWVGHSPDVDRMTAALIGGNDALLHFSKGAVAALRFDGPLEIGAAELRWLIPGKML
jgi:phosphohistidine phosphatase SixA